MGFLASSSLFMLLTTLLFNWHSPASSTSNDFRYMRSVRNAIDFPLVEKEYDYIIIGGGTAGCPLAATLSLKHSVLVLERGNIPQASPIVQTVEGFLSHIVVDEDNETTPFQKIRSEDKVVSLRGRVLGGSSMINAGFYSRADKDFLSESGIKWDIENVRKAYEWVEKSLVFRPRIGVWQSAFREAVLEAGIVPDNGFTLDHVSGTKVSGSIFDEHGRRHGAVELLNRGNFENLRIAVLATVERIIFSSKKSKISAIGVIYSDSHGNTHRAHVKPKGEIILSAGAIGSPQILLLSGIGPNSYLSSQHIQVVHSNPSVGKFMADNPRNSVPIVTPFPVEPSSPQVVGISHDYFLEGISVVVRNNSHSNTSVARITEKISGPLSKGLLWLNSSTDAKSPPRVKFNYLSHPVDLSRCVEATRKIGKILNSKAMDRFKHEANNGSRYFVFGGPSLPENQSDDLQMGEFCRQTVNSIHHCHGGCVVGKVVDVNLRVIGVDSLRVVDGSTFKSSPGTNPQATVMMLGRYIGLKILRERRDLK